ncbi:MAG: TonB-dependent receptor plug domain-containing protein [Pirellulales bacterium]
MLRDSLVRYTLAAFSAAALSAGLRAQTAAAPAASPDDALVLTPFSVTAEKSTGYKVSSASTATRTNTALIDIPQTVDIVTKEFWDDVGATTFDQSFRYVANVYVRNRNAGSGDGVNLRGFETNGSISVDGVRMGNNKRDPRRLRAPRSGEGPALRRAGSCRRHRPAQLHPQEARDRHQRDHAQVCALDG